MSDRRGSAILREIAQVKASDVRPEIKERMLAELQAELDARYGAVPPAANPTGVAPAKRGA